MNIGYMETPIGVLRIKTENSLIVEIHAMTPTESMSEAGEDNLIIETKKQLEEYFRGKRKNFDLPLDMTAGTWFQQEVWACLKKIPYGKTMSYGEVARALGRAGASRAVGNAVGKNPFLIVVPCHRVIKGDGSIGGFSSGLDKKRGLMQIENIQLTK